MKRILKLILQIIIPVLIVLGCLDIVKKLIASKPPLKSKPVEKVIPSLSVETYSAADHSPSIHSFGLITSQFETELKPQVTGQILEVSPQFNVGKRIPKGTVLVQIDKTDYESALAQAEYNLTQASFQLEEERVLAKQAKEDWFASGRKIEDASNYLLRKPQIKAAEANVLAMEKAIEKAETDIKRTSITSPFNAIVSSRNASPGNLATQQEILGNLVSTDTAEVKLPLSKDELARLPEFTADKPLEIILTSPLRPDIEWIGKLVRIDPTIDASNQTIYAIAEISKPYAPGKTPLSVGTFVNAKLPSKKIEKCFAIPNTAIINDQFIWLVAKQEDKHILKKKFITRILSDTTTSYVHIKEHASDIPVTIVVRPLTNLKEDGEILPENN